MTKRSVTIVHSRYGWYQREYFSALCQAFDVRLVTIFDELPDDPMPSDLISATQRRSMGMQGVRVRHYSPVRLWKLFASVWKATAGTSVILTSTQNPVHSKVAWAVARLRRVPICVVVEQWQDYPGQGWLKERYNRLSMALMRSADRCFVHGALARDFALGSGVSSERIRRYPHMNADLGCGSALPLPVTNEFRVLYVGRLVEVKGLDVLLAAFSSVVSQHPSAQLLMCGDGELRADLEAQAAPFAGHVEFRGRIAPSDLAQVMASCHVLVLPSRQLPLSYEGWGLVVGEAASVGRALVVSSAVGSAPELVDSGVNGYVVREGDIRALSQALLKLASDPDAVREFGLESRRRFDEYCDANECVRLLREVMR